MAGTPPADAEIIAIGSELLTPQRLDTNSLFLTEHLNRLGVELRAKHVVGDDRERLTAAIRDSLQRVEIVLLSGGLGPTEDDVTRDAAAAAVGRRLIHSRALEEALRARFASIRRNMAENNLRQTLLIDGAEPLPNPNGTAAGQFVRVDERALVLLPGPPRELQAMFLAEVVPRLRPLVPPSIIRVRSFRVTGMGESDLDALIAPVYTPYSNLSTTILSAVGDLFVHLRARCATVEEAEQLLKEVGDPIAELLGNRAYTTDPDEALEMVVGKLLRQRGEMIAVAESCTGGLVAARLSEHAGSSAFFAGGMITYTDRQKHHLLGVPEDLLVQHTAVSEPVARAMAEGARLKTGADRAVSLTGYAGPDGGTESDPVGTVYFGLSSPARTRVVRHRFGLDRTRVRQLATQMALDLIRRELLDPA